VDNLCDSSGVVAPGHGEFLYARGIHSHSAGVGGNRAIDPIGPGAKARIVSWGGGRIYVSGRSWVPIAGAKQKK
jgi:hypothetical protein